MPRRRRSVRGRCVALRSFRLRPEKCCEGAAWMVRSVPGTLCDCHQSSSVMRSGAIPQACRCAPTPSEVTKGMFVLAIWRMVG